MSRVLFKIYAWQNSRAPWFYLALLCASLVVLAHGFFQNYLYMLPCEQCVYIRLAFLIMLLGAVLGFVFTRNFALKICAYVTCFVGAIYGILRSLHLWKVHEAVLSKNPFGVHGCSFKPHFPLNLPLDEIFPSMFKPTGDCGLDAPVVPQNVSLDSVQLFFVELYKEGWFLLPSAKFGTMAQCTFLAFVVCLIFLSVMFIAQIYGSFSKKI